MFSGAYAHSLDSKGRTVMPARFRMKLGEKFVITRGLHGCLWVFPERSWAETLRKFAPRSLLDDRGVKLERYFLGSAAECVPDRQGRVAIPPMLLEHAGIKTDLWIVGLSDRIEIWAKDRWDAFNAALTDDVIVELGREFQL
ncbi:MAG: division/cell wall cluster transcriptional repressor MraZ [Armatimonadota bacterium]|nr:division/cell wall cluster transcriptional repressor MraZ [Armatimonadota bacterium]